MGITGVAFLAKAYNDGMSWLAQLITSISLFFSSIFGLNQFPVQNALTPQVSPTTSIEQGTTSNKQALVMNFVPAAWENTNGGAGISSKDWAYVYSISGSQEFQVAVSKPSNNGKEVFSSYIRDSKNIYWHDNAYSHGTFLVSADYPTFEVANLDWMIAKDKSHVFLAGDILPNVDSKTAQIFSEYIKDKNSVYIVTYASSCSKGSKQIAIRAGTPDLVGCLNQVQTADTLTFVSLGHGYFKDNKKVYFTTYDAIHEIARADANSFLFFASNLPSNGVDDNDYYGFYAKDRNDVYYKDRIVVGADVSFSLLHTPSGKNSGYAKDKRYIYNAFTAEMLKGTDVTTFVVLNNGYAKDRYHVYAWNPDVLLDGIFTTGTILENADPLTFQTVSGNSKHDAKDAKYYYLEARVVK